MRELLRREATMPGVGEAVEKLEKALVAAPEKGLARNSPATATLQRDLSVRVSGPRGESLATDMPPALGGAAAAPPPGWLLRAGLASCTATVIAMRAARLGVVLDTLEVTVESESDNRGMLGTDDNVSAALSALVTRVRIGATGAAFEQLREIAEWGDLHSPVASTLREGRPIRVDIDVA
jgi:uncharacterized OsmC-like protein